MASCEAQHNFKTRIGPLPSGASVLAAGEQSASTKLQHRKVTGIDMEAYAVFAASDEAPLPQPKAFVLKSVSDFADDEKDDSIQPYTVYDAAISRTLTVWSFG